MSVFNRTTSVRNDSLQAHNSWEKSLLVLFFSVLTMVIVLGNILVIFAYKKNSRLRTGTYKFLASLALSDFLVGTVSLPMWICISSNLFLSNSFTTAYLTLDIFSSMTSISHLIAISVERFIAVSKPFVYQNFGSFHYNCVLVVVWLYGAVAAVLFPIQKEFDLRKMYAIAVFVVGFALPLSIISTMYIGIFKVARRLIHFSPPQLQGSHQKLMYQELKVAMTLFIITGLFFLLWLPQFTTTIVAAFGMLRLPWNESSRIVAAVKFLHYLNSALNPFLYAFRDAEMHRTFKRLLTFF